MALNSRNSLEERLSRVLPEGCRFIIHHLSTPPTKCPAIFAAPPGAQPEETYCEKHFLSVSIDSDGHQLQVFAIEVYIYTTEHLTALFVSKVDSTGYLHLLKLPEGTPSPLRVISSTFLIYLIEERRRPDRQLILSLFARANNQYLFPGSVENSHKHVLDDRGLIKWWCKVVDSILGTFQNDKDVCVGPAHESRVRKPDTKSHGYLRVPGCETYETRNFLPKNDWARSRWSISADPLGELGISPNAPERCLVPRFPDDPKARFAEQLDDELPEVQNQPSSSQEREVQPAGQDAGRWRSVKSLEQFWEMMSFRQECSSGRLVGFLWATFQPASLHGSGEAGDVVEHTNGVSQSVLPTPLGSQHRESSSPTPQSARLPSAAPDIISTTPPMSPSKPSPAPTPIKAKEAAIRAQPEETKCYYWPRSSRGEVVLRQKDYQRVGQLLIDLDYAGEEIAADSTKQWINAVAERAGVESWGRTVVGHSAPVVMNDACASANPTMLNAGLVRKKKRPAESQDGPAEDPVTVNGTPPVNTLSTGLLRKKAKIANHVGLASSQEEQSNGNTAPG